MFDSLHRAIAELVIPADPRALAALVAVRDRLDAKIAAAVGAVDAARLFEESGATSMYAWLRDLGIDRRDAACLVRTGRRLQRLPVVAEAWAAGELSGGQVQAIVDHVPDKHVALFAEHEEAVVPSLVGLDVNATSRAMAEWKARADALADENEAGMPERSLHHSVVGDRYAMDGDFDAEGGAVIDHALVIAESGDYTVPAAKRRADALVEVCRQFLDHHDRAPVVRHRPHVNLVLYAGDDRAEVMDSGRRLDPATTSRLLCDCNINRVIAEKVGRAGSVILDYGTTTRVVSPALWSALAVRDRQCRYPGCDRPPSWCDAHHVHWFSKGGPTRLDNLVLLCRRHHTLLHHKPGFDAKLRPDATLELTLPDGTTRTTHPRTRTRAGPLPLAC